MDKNEFAEVARNLPVDALINLNERLSALEEALAPAPAEAATPAEAAK